MPELPEVETVVRELKTVLEGQSFIAVKINSPALRIPIPAKKIKDLMGIKIAAITRRAKYIIIDFENNKTMLCHLGMTGSFTVFTKSEIKKYDADRHDHIVFKTSSGKTLVYRDPRRFGLLDVIKTDEKKSCKWLGKLGLEPFDAEFTAQYLHAILMKKTIAIKPAIMDQSLVVGVGNIYASEALYNAQIDPRARACDITPKHLTILIDEIRHVLERAIVSGGSTLRDYRRPDGGKGEFQHHFSVYDRAGEACPDCTCKLHRTGGIQRIVQAGRSTFFCPSRQKKS